MCSQPHKIRTLLCPSWHLERVSAIVSWLLGSMQLTGNILYAQGYFSILYLNTLNLRLSWFMKMFSQRLSGLGRTLIWLCMSSCLFDSSEIRSWPQILFFPKGLYSKMNNSNSSTLIYFYLLKKQFVN
jgi:hypothetical protein